MTQNSFLKNDFLKENTINAPSNMRNTFDVQNAECTNRFYKIPLLLLTVKILIKKVTSYEIQIISIGNYLDWSEVLLSDLNG